MMLGQRAVSYGDFVRALLIVAAIIVVMLALNYVFGFNGSGPSFDLTTDPGAAVGLHF